MARSLAVLSVAVLLALSQAACHHGRRTGGVPLPPAPTATAPGASSAPSQTTPSQTPPAQAGGEGGKPAASAPTTVTEIPPPPTTHQENRPAQETRPRKPRPASTTPANPPATTPATTPPATQPAPPQPATPVNPPRLGAILTPEQQREYNNAIDQSLARAQASLGSIANRSLSSEQQTTVEQVQAFVRQAQEARKNDLSAAKSLAERAEVLARDLAASLR